MTLPPIASLPKPQTADPMPMLRLHYQSLAAMLGRTLVKTDAGFLAYEPLLDSQIKAGAAEWAVTGFAAADGPNMAGQRIYRSYQGYVAVYYPLGTTPGRAATDDIKIATALELFPRIAVAYAASAPGIECRQVDFDGSGNAFVLKTPEVPGQPGVLALSVNWALTLELTVTF
ncbi:hypothetical protein EHF33_20695 (plasmid) [Deinococcus psychrotolerans]|uniref:Uncharacterized protein n=1 Tax=Deinococcus psychrotolerans TaxID=2489213 RepID=A0A3G8YUQ4_9DEIO|nr:hypothetical protein [Deinococcus psychrotolerans]AZI45331.1 hypothetical protein EHF33_20695 [Deinococcus psychrotolerans]